MSRDTVSYQAIDEGTGERMQRFIPRFEPQIARRLAHEEAIARRSFAHCGDWRETAAVYSWLRRN